MDLIRCGHCKAEKTAIEFAPSQRKNGSWCRACFKGKYREVSPALPPRPCEVCSIEIAEPVPRQRFCSAACKMRARYKRLNPKAVRNCASCGTDITQMRANARYCSKRCSERARKADGRVTSASRRAWRIKNQYGITVEEYDQMLTDQGYGCAICGGDGSSGVGGLLHVDHCHGSGQVRGLLCGSCNLALGNFKDTPAILRRAADYLESARKDDEHGASP